MSSGPESDAPVSALTSTVTLKSGELPRTWDTTIRAIDLTLATLALIMLILILLIITAAIRLSSSGAALFRQRRLGEDARPFTVLKTMRAVASFEGQ